MTEHTLSEDLKQLNELKESGALADEEFATAKASLLKGNEDKEIIIPEVMDEKLDPKYAREFSEDGFWDLDCQAKCNIKFP